MTIVLAMVILAGAAASATGSPTAIEPTSSPCS
jgi:hypothetical protein